MRTRCLTIAVLTVSTLILSACASGPATGMGSTRPLLVTRDYSGDDANLKFADIFLVNSKAELERRGSQDLVKKDVDFTRQSLVVVTLGEQKRPGYWVRITGVQQRGDQLFVQFQANKPAKVDPTATAPVAAPYAAVVIPKVSAATLVPEPRYSEGAAIPPEPFISPVMTATAPATMPVKK